jgi:ketosteroid isomerase-like protein
VDERVAHLWTLRDGRITGLEYFGDAAEAQRSFRYGGSSFGTHELSHV